MRMLRPGVIAIVLTGVLAVPQAHAISKAEAKAEHVRLSEEMNKHTRKARWHGVERAYEKMQPLLKKQQTKMLLLSYLIQIH